MDLRKPMVFCSSEGKEVKYDLTREARMSDYERR